MRHASQAIESDGWEYVKIYANFSRKGAKKRKDAKARPVLLRPGLFARDSCVLMFLASLCAFAFFAPLREILFKSP
jgi:hypothetical protein